MIDLFNFHEFENPTKIGFLGVLANQKTAGTPDSRRRPSGSRLVAGGCPAACRHSAGGTSPRSTLSNVRSGCRRRWLRCCDFYETWQKARWSAYYLRPGKRVRKAGNFGPRDPQQHPQQIPYADLRQVLHTLAESVQSLGARMDAVETPGGIPGRVQAPNPLSLIATAPFSFQQPSGSAPSTFTGYAPGTCSGTTATAAPRSSPFRVFSRYSSTSPASGRLNRDKEEKGIVAGQRLGTSASGGGPSAGLKRETFAANNPFLLHVVVHVLEGVKAKVPSPQFILNLG
ncbi:unnamed protein product [Boreogadus saida]